VIVTVTPNPSIDRTIEIERLERGGMIRAAAATSEAAGKGINVSRALTVEGVETLAVVPLANESKATYLALLADAVPTVNVPVPGTIRMNISLVEPDGTVTKVNEPGPLMDDPDVEAILAAVAAVAAADWIVGCGSLPPGAPTDFYARLLRLASTGRRVAVDSSGEALAAAVTAGVALIKPNLPELEQLSGRRITTLGDAVDAACELVGRGVGAVLLSLGSDGAMYVERDGAARHAEASIEDAANSVGAGDALLAGFLAAGADSSALPEAVAWSVAAVRSPGTRMRPVTDVDRDAVVVHARIDRDRRPRP
jgi:1-phosphofructokinase family hexose kinase